MLYGYGKHGETYCECTCECGNKCIKSSYGLRKGNAYPNNCGCKTEEYRKIQAEKSRIDITGQRFGKLVVVKIMHEFKKQTMVKCKCDCGNTITRPLTYITSGETTSCGCYQKQRASENNVKDFSGVISDYGVTLLNQNSMNDKGQWLWNCKCGFCGTIFIALPAKVMNGHIRSCGCIKKSSGEKMVEKVLKNTGVDYISQYKLSRNDSSVPLKLDFYIPSCSTGIEFQGLQHFKVIEYFGGEEGFRHRQELDKLKKQICEDKKIKLYEIMYDTPLNEIENIITNIIYPERLSCSYQQ